MNDTVDGPDTAADHVAADVITSKAVITCLISDCLHIFMLCSDLQP